MYIPEVNPRIKHGEIYLRSAGESILEGNDHIKIKKRCLGKSLNGKAIQQAQVVMDMGLDYKKALEETIDNLRKSFLTRIPMNYILYLV